MQTKKIGVDKGSKCYTRLLKSWSQDDDIKMYLTHIEEKSVVADRSFRTLKYKIYKYITSVSKNLYINELNDIVNKYNNTYHSAIKMKPAM